VAALILFGWGGGWSPATAFCTATMSATEARLHRSRRRPMRCCAV